MFNYQHYAEQIKYSKKIPVYVNQEPYSPQLMNAYLQEDALVRAIVTEIRYVAKGEIANGEQIQSIAIALLLARQIMSGKRDDDIVIDDLTVEGFKNIITQIKIMQLEDVIKEIAGKK